MDFTYTKFWQHLMGGDVDLLTDNIKCVACSSGYTPNKDTDEFLSNIPAGSQLSISPNMAGKTVTNGVFDCDDFNFPTVVPTSPPTNVTQLVWYQDTGDAATSVLIAKVDTWSGLPVTPNGEDIHIQIPNDVNRIFKVNN